MKWDEIGDQPCSVARTLSVLGDRWTMLILRNAFMGIRRFDDFQRSLGLTRHVLSERLKRLELTSNNSLLNEQENESIKHTLQNERVALFDGTSALAVGTDDTFRNMRWRLDKVCSHHELGQIVIEIFDRVQNEENNNVYSRARKRHTRERTRWW